jgi:hypothetical protein
MALQYNDVSITLRQTMQPAVQQNKVSLQQARNLVAQAATQLAAMPTTYGTTVTAINAGVAANPENAAWLAIKAELDLVVANFQSVLIEANALKTAVDAVAQV